MSATKMLVVKIGTNALTTEEGLLDTTRIRDLVGEICAVRKRGVQVVLVSSGAVGAGIGRLGLKERPKFHPQLQAVAAIGQGKLIQTYEEEFEARGVVAAQLLLTAGDLSNRTRYLNARNTFASLFAFGAVPIVNENDAVSSSELSLTFGDNDRLASIVANLFPESLLVLLTDVEGLYDGDPANPKSKLVSVVDEWSPDLMALVSEKATSRGKGGMSSKLKAAQSVVSAGGAMIIANGNDPKILTKIFNGEECGTLFLPGARVSARKRWFRFMPPPCGALVVDVGAANALARGKSLLPIGVVGCRGAFKKGDVVEIVDGSNRAIARGLTNYSSKDAAALCGKRSSEIAQALELDHCPYEEIVHRDNLHLVE